MLPPVASVFLIALAATLVATSPKVQRFFHAWRQRQRTGKGGW